MGDWGPDQVDSTSKNTLQDRERRSRVRHPRVMFSHFPTLPPYVLRYILLRTAQKSQSIRETHPETVRGFTIMKRN